MPFPRETSSKQGIMLYICRFQATCQPTCWTIARISLFIESDSLRQTTAETHPVSHQRMNTIQGMDWSHLIELTLPNVFLGCS